MKYFCQKQEMESLKIFVRPNPSSSACGLMVMIERCQRLDPGPIPGALFCFVGEYNELK
jgi:hypothetical protein